MGGSTYHTHSCTSEGKGGVIVPVFSFFLFFAAELQLDRRVIGSRDTADTALQKSGIKADDISQRSLQRSQINVHSLLLYQRLDCFKILIKACWAPPSATTSVEIGVQT